MNDSIKLAQLHLRQVPSERRTLQELQSHYSTLVQQGVSTSTLAALIAEQEFVNLYRESAKLANEMIQRAMRR